MQLQRSLPALAIEMRQVWLELQRCAEVRPGEVVASLVGEEPTTRRPGRSQGRFKRERPFEVRLRFVDPP